MMNDSRNPSELRVDWLRRQKEDFSAGRGIGLEGYLALEPALADNLELCVDLVYGEFWLRESAGETPSPETYVARFPHLRAELERLFEVHHALGDAGSRSMTFDATLPHNGNATFDSKNMPTAGKGRFHVLRPHARGGLGEVLVAIDEELCREVALKRIQPGFADDTDCRRRFVAEAEITGGLEHPGVVPVYSLGMGDDGRPYYAMRFIRGISLKEAADILHAAPDAAGHTDRIRFGLELRKLLRRFVTVCETIEYAHSRGVLHRDLKPGNIMLGDYGETLVVDWGLAKRFGSDDATAETIPQTSTSPDLTQTGGVVGTPQFMSPEQAAGTAKALSPRSDVYSLGSTLFYVLTGKPPFVRTPNVDILEEVRAGRIPEARSVHRDVLPTLNAICRKATALRPSDRYASARALAEELEHWFADEPTVAYREPLTHRLARYARRHRGVAVTSAASLVVVAILTTTAAWLIDLQRQAAERLSAENSRIAAREVDARNHAEARKQEAERERDRALRQAKLNRSLQLGSNSRLLVTDKPQLALHLAIEAVESLRQDGIPIPTAVEEALRNNVARVSGIALPGHAGSVTCVAFSPDGRWIATVSQDGRIKLWNPSAFGDRPTPAFELAMRTHVFCLRFLHAGRFFAAALQNGVRLWRTDGTPFEEVGDWPLKYPQGRACLVTDFALSPDERWLAAALSDVVHANLWDIRTPRSESRIAPPKDRHSRTGAVGFDPTSRYFVFGPRSLRPIGAIDLTSQKLEAIAPADVASGIQLDRLLTPDVIEITSTSVATTTPAFVRPRLQINSQAARRFRDNPAGVELVSTSPPYEMDDHLLKILRRTATGREQEILLYGHDHTLNDLSATADGRRAVTGGMDGSARLWSLDNPQPTYGGLSFPSVPSTLNRFAASADRRFAVFLGRDTRSVGRLKVDDTVRLLPNWYLSDVVTAIAIGSRGAAATTSSTTWYHPHDGKPIALSEPDGAPTAKIVTLKFSADGRRLAAVDAEGWVRIWSENDGHFLPSLTADIDAKTPTSLEFLPDGQRFVVRLAGERLGFFSLRLVDRSLEKLAEFSAGEISVKGSGYRDRYAMSVDGRFVVCGCGGSMQVIDVATGMPLRTDYIRNIGMIDSIVFGSYARRFVTSSRGQGVSFWQISDDGRLTHDRRIDFDDHTQTFLAPDDAMLVTGRRNGEAALHDLTTSDPRATLRVVKIGEGAVADGQNTDGMIDAAGRFFIFEQAGAVCALELKLDDVLASARRKIGRDLTADEQRTYLSH